MDRVDLSLCWRRRASVSLALAGWSTISPDFEAVRSSPQQTNYQASDQVFDLAKGIFHRASPRSLMFQYSTSPFHSGKFASRYHRCSQTCLTCEGVEQYLGEPATLVVPRADE